MCSIVRWGCNRILVHAIENAVYLSRKKWFNRLIIQIQFSTKPKSSYLALRLAPTQYTDRVQYAEATTLRPLNSFLILIP
jgi:hypothetical protein